MIIDACLNRGSRGRRSFGLKRCASTCPPERRADHLRDLADQLVSWLRCPYAQGRPRGSWSIFGSARWSVFNFRAKTGLDLTLYNPHN
jgi:hypothetical protein